MQHKAVHFSDGRAGALFASVLYKARALVLIAVIQDAGLRILNSRISPDFRKIIAAIRLGTAEGTLKDMIRGITTYDKDAQRMGAEGNPFIAAIKPDPTWGCEEMERLENRLFDVDKIRALLRDERLMAIEDEDITELLTLLLQASAPD